MKAYLETLLSKGYLLSKDVFEFLEKLSENEIEKLISNLEETKTVKLLTSEEIKRILKKQELTFNLIKFRQIEKNRVSISEFQKLIKYRYEFISKILSKRIDIVNLISINKITKRTRKFTVIGRVVEKNDDLIKIEDLTGTLEINVEGKEIFKGEIAAFFCLQENNEIIAKKIYFPDIPLKREIKKIDEKILLTFDESVTNLPTILIKKDKEMIIKDERLQTSYKFFPVHFQISNLNILLFSFKEIENEIEKNKFDVNGYLKRILKRRIISIDERKLLGLAKDAFLIEDIPDIVLFISNSKQEKIENYKGTTIIQIPEGKEVVIDLKEREIIKK